MVKNLLLLCVALLSLGIIDAQTNPTEWVERYDKKGLTVFTRQDKTANTVEYKSVTTIDADIDRCTSILKDFHNHPNFLYRVKSVRLIESLNDQTLCLYYVIDFPFPLTDRDLVIQSDLEQNGPSTEVVYRFEARPNKAPLTGKVRIGVLDGLWKLRRVDKNHTEIITQGKSTTRGLPFWLVNLFLYKIPKITMHRFEEVVLSVKRGK